MMYMALDNELAKEIKAFVGKGEERKSCVRVNQTVQKAAEEMEKASRYDGIPIGECAKKYGRAAVAICIASTLWERKEILGNWNLEWAIDVLNQWGWRDRYATRRGLIGGNAHPTAICCWAKSFIEYTSETA